MKTPMEKAEELYCELWRLSKPQTPEEWSKLTSMSMLCQASMQRAIAWQIGRIVEEMQLASYNRSLNQ